MTRIRELQLPFAFYAPTISNFADSLQNTAVTISGYSAQRRNVNAALRFTTSATRVIVYVVNNIVGNTGVTSLEPSYRVDGGAVAALGGSPSAQGNWNYPLSLDGASHTVEIWDGYQEEWASHSPSINGAFTWQISANAPVTFLTNPSVTSRIVVYGDSITCGAKASPNSLGWAQRLRGGYTPGRVSVEAFGGRSLWDDSGSGSGQYGFASATLTAARLTGLLFDATTRIIIDAMGVNDWGQGHWSQSDYGTGCAALYDAIHAADPNAVIYAMSPLITDMEAVTHGFGNIGTYRSAKQTACAGRSWVTFEDGPSFMNVSGLSGAGDVHPSATGMAGIYDGSGASAGSINWKTILGF